MSYETYFTLSPACPQQGVGTTQEWVMGEGECYQSRRTFQTQQRKVCVWSPVSNPSSNSSRTCLGLSAFQGSKDFITVQKARWREPNSQLPPRAHTHPHTYACTHICNTRAYTYMHVARTHCLCFRSRLLQITREAGINLSTWLLLGAGLILGTERGGERGLLKLRFWDLQDHSEFSVTLFPFWPIACGRSRGSFGLF